MTPHRSLLRRRHLQAAHRRRRNMLTPQGRRVYRLRARHHVSHLSRPPQLPFHQRRRVHSHKRHGLRYSLERNASDARRDVPAKSATERVKQVLAHSNHTLWRRRLRPRSLVHRRPEVVRSPRQRVHLERHRAGVCADAHRQPAPRPRLRTLGEPQQVPRPRGDVQLLLHVQPEPHARLRRLEGDHERVADRLHLVPAVPSARVAHHRVVHLQRVRHRRHLLPQRRRPDNVGEHDARLAAVHPRRRHVRRVALRRVQVLHEPGGQVRLVAPQVVQQHVQGVRHPVGQLLPLLQQQILGALQVKQRQALRHVQRSRDRRLHPRLLLQHVVCEPPREVEVAHEHSDKLDGADDRRGVPARRVVTGADTRACLQVGLAREVEEPEAERLFDCHDEKPQRHHTDQEAREVARSAQHEKQIDDDDEERPAAHRQPRGSGPVGHQHTGRRAGQQKVQQRIAAPFGDAHVSQCEYRTAAGDGEVQAVDLRERLLHTVRSHDPKEGNSRHETHDERKHQHNGLSQLHVLAVARHDRVPIPPLHPKAGSKVADRHDVHCTCPDPSRLPPPPFLLPCQ
eukprot:Rhum_TRINITY_DN15224_c2_g1::Rhum_TRINITY_DN15224_c2_g1_i2::g.145596::m.145596